MKRVVLLAAICGLALGGAGCGTLPDVTDVQDLRVLAVKCEPAGFLVDLMDPGGFMNDPNGADPATFRAQITALVADPLAPGGMLTVSSAFGCPDVIDTVTAATGQATKTCPAPPATPPAPGSPESFLATTAIVAPDMPQSFPSTAANDIAYEPQVSFGLQPDQIKAFFTLTGMDPTVDKIIQNNRDFGLSAIVNLNFDLGNEHAAAIKNVVYWPLLDPNEQPNTNPTLAGIDLYQHRNPDTGDPEDLYTDPNPTLSISAGDKLYVQPVYLPDPRYPNYPGAADQNYLLRVRNTQTVPNTVDTQVVARELIRFNFYTSGGTMDPPLQMSELNPILSGTSTLHTDAEYVLPKAADVVQFGKVTIWIVTHDERAGSDWMSTTITLVP